jgi:hypothetical protein
MRFLHSKGNAAAFAGALLLLSLNFTSLGASPNPNAETGTGEDVDLAKVQSGAEVVFISSGKHATVSRAIDDDRRTVFEFADSDPRPVLIVKLTNSAPIRRVSLVAGSQTGKVDVYLLNQLPRDPSALDKTNPIGSIVDAAVASEATLNFPPQTARYIVLRWTVSKQAPRAISLAEVSAFGPDVLDPAAITLAAADPPPDPVEGPPAVTVISP